MSAADAQCPYLSPANFSLIQDRFECAGYVTLSSPSFSCTGPYSPVCKYAGISDFVPIAPKVSECSTFGEPTLICDFGVPAPDSACPPFTTFNSKTYELSTAICLSSVGFIATPYVSLFSQFQCGDGLYSRIVNQQAGCFVLLAGASVCPLGHIPTCYYAVPKPDSY